VEGRSTGGDRRLRSFCHPVWCVCAVRADSAIHWKPPAVGNGHTTSVCNQPTQHLTLSGTRNKYRPKCRDALWTGSNGRLAHSIRG